MTRLFILSGAVLLLALFAQVGKTADDDKLALVVTVNPGAQTVQVRSEPANPAVDLATYTVTATPDPNSAPHGEIKPGDVIEWLELTASFEFKPVGNVTETPANPTASANTTTQKIDVHADAPGRWQMKVYAKVKFQKLRLKPNTTTTEYEVDGEFIGEGTTKTPAWFTATDSDVIISLAPIIVREAKNEPKKRVIYEGTVMFADPTFSGAITLGATKADPNASASGAILLAKTKAEIELNAQGQGGAGNASITWVNIAAGGTENFYAYGTAESDKMDDVVVTEVNASKPDDALGKVNVTVLWVEISRKNTDEYTISDENEAKQAISP